MFFDVAVRYIWSVNFATRCFSRMLTSCLNMSRLSICRLRCASTGYSSAILRLLLSTVFFVMMRTRRSVIGVPSFIILILSPLPFVVSVLCSRSVIVFLPVFFRPGVCSLAPSSIHFSLSLLSI
ncbi:hypothetical protein CPB85DRAFT_173387 [Mucidula mucida]|nr:hypothetical protein CPB85DRAFT_173387 [Mucidula mucida]